MRAREVFSPAQCRAARGLVDWTPEDLADRARLELETVELYERGDGGLEEREMAALGGAFSSAGVIAIAPNMAGEGVRFSRPDALAARLPFVSMAWTGEAPAPFRRLAEVLRGLLPHLAPAGLPIASGGRR